MVNVRLRVAVPDDVAFVTATERGPGFENMVGQWSERHHLDAMASADYAYLIGTDATKTPRAFAILRDLSDSHGNVCLKRIAVTDPGQGFGSVFFGKVVTWTFNNTDAHRLWLDVLADNGRAQHVYQAHGFAGEGRLRDAFRLPNGCRIDLLLMSVLRSEWQRRQPGAA